MKLRTVRNILAQCVAVNENQLKLIKRLSVETVVERNALVFRKKHIHLELLAVVNAMKNCRKKKLPVDNIVTAN